MNDAVEERIATLYTQSSTAAMRLAWVLTGDRSAAEDLFHDAFLRLYEIARDPDAQPIDDARAYLRRSMINLAANRRRALGTWNRYLPKLAGSAALQTPDPDSRLVVMAALGRLNARHRALIVARYYEDMTVAETAAALGCKPGSVKSGVARALERLSRMSELTHFLEEQ